MDSNRLRRRRIRGRRHRLVAMSIGQEGCRPAGPSRHPFELKKEPRIRLQSRQESSSSVDCAPYLARKGPRLELVTMSNRVARRDQGRVDALGDSGKMRGLRFTRSYRRSNRDGWRRLQRVMHGAMADRSTDCFDASLGCARRKLYLDGNTGDPPGWRLAHRPRATHRRSLPAGAQAAAGVMGDARRQGCDEEIGGCRACVLAARLPRLVDDHFMTAHRDPVAVTAEADDC